MIGMTVVRGAACGAVFILAACAGKPGAPKVPPGVSATPSTAASVVACTPQPNNPLIGNWYATSTPKGVSGQFQTLTKLHADGTMGFETQLKIGKRLRPALRETGCWSFADGIFTQQTLRSNGDEVDANDPIYRNRYRIERLEATRFIMREMVAGSQAVTAKKMPDGYRMPDR